MSQHTLFGRRTYGVTLDRQCDQAGLPVPVAEYAFHPTRKWRFDWAFPVQQLAVEVEGGSWMRGRHTRGDGFTKDIEKYAEALCAGWRILRITPPMIRTGQALAYLERILRPNGGPS